MSRKVHDNGGMDVFVMRKPSRVDLILTFLALEKGDHVRRPSVECYRVKKFVLEPARCAGSINISGEMYPAKPVFVECFQKAAIFWC